MFAQVREDPRVELEALQSAFAGTIAVVSSGGCTALSLLAAGAQHVMAVDLSPAQNHLVELKYAAIRALPPPRAVAFLGGQPMRNQQRLQVLAMLLPLLGDAAREYWRGHARAVARGVLRAGRSERFIGHVSALVRRGVVRRDGVARLLRADTLDEQRAIFERDWQGWRWRALFRALLNRWTMSRAYAPSFFAHVHNDSFASHFRALAERGLTTIPARTNYFLHEMLTGRYPVAVVDGLPPYLAGETAGEAFAGNALELVDGTMTDALRARPARSVDGFALSNICEWMDDAAIDALCAEIVRVARPGARVVFRNFVGWTHVPERWRHVMTERAGMGEMLILRDRSLVQHRVVVCDVRTRP